CAVWDGSLSGYIF
nr:immunoglobulin light chain junction region [Macaca mulatta]MPO06653.1 immunoglobulin light chain junction region [Macaca mulatta]MPO08243.1 immunoglobulin light chain junction region [Macaca mulatta]MPO11397.1 immunoglobulin light chain junction region [Macaca mulatta]MPO12488.1 immunoglobulin light chain junction region [Macaca mulatta]